MSAFDTLTAPRKGARPMVTRKKYDSQKKWDLEYKKERTKTKTVRFFPKDMDLFEYSETKGNFAGYIKELIRADMEKNK